ncbi:MAG: Nramp family divalent metal transporter [Bacteroidota bacterium]
MNENTHDKSLSDIHESIDPSIGNRSWKRVFAFFGPAYLVSVGYMDPGNWATDIAGGSQFGYTLLWVLLMSNLMALLLQSLSARLGIVQGRDLAQCSREAYPTGVNFTLYILAEIAIAACDLAEVLGMAIGLNLLLGIPIMYGVLITFLDTLLLLYLQKLGMRKLEAFIVTLISIIGLCFLIEMFFAQPSFYDIAKGFNPTLPNHMALYIAISIIGATVMPHNLYLHSALVQTRKINRETKSIWRAIKFNTIDSIIALNLAFFVNAAILILAAAAFFSSGHHTVASLQDAHRLLAPLLGNKWASHLFAIALIASGQSSTITGTLAGQIVMEGYLRLRINPLVRRIITRSLAIIPAVIIILIMGDSMVDSMLIFSQVLLSMQLAFAVIPLIHFVSDKKRMTVFAIKPIVQIAAWFVAIIIVALNLKLVFESALEWMGMTNNILLKTLIILGEIGLLLLLFITIFYPLITKRKERNIDIHSEFDMNELHDMKVEPFSTIALALDYSEKDQKVIQYALQLAKPGTSFILIHIVESVSAKMMGNDAHDYETIKDREQLNEYVRLFSQRNFAAEGVLGFKSRTNEIVRIVSEKKCDLLILGSHGHKNLKDIIFGETINTVRHMVHIPVFIAQ